MVHLAVKIHDETRDGQTKTLIVHQLYSIMAASNLVALAEFWRTLQRLADPDQEIRIRAEAILGELGDSHWRAAPVRRLVRSTPLSWSILA